MVHPYVGCAPRTSSWCAEHTLHKIIPPFIKGGDLPLNTNQFLQFNIYLHLHKTIISGVIKIMCNWWIVIWFITTGRHPGGIELHVKITYLVAVPFEWVFFLLTFIRRFFISAFGLKGNYHRRLRFINKSRSLF